MDEMPLMMSEEGFENDESDYHTLPRARITRRKRGLEWFVCGGWKFLCTRFVVCCYLIITYVTLAASLGVRCYVCYVGMKTKENAVIVEDTSNISPHQRMLF